MIRLLTLNLWKNEGDFPARLASVIAEINALEVDIACLQEVYQDDHIDVASVVARGCSLAAIFAPAREKLRNGKLSRSGLAILSRFPVCSKTTIALPSTEEDGGRVALLATIDTPSEPITVVSLHLSHLRGDAGEASRARQWTKIIEAAPPRSQNATIYAGDFNALATEPWLAQACEAHNLTTSASRLPSKTSLRSHQYLLIDHVVYRRGTNLKMKNAILCLTGPSEPSDHFGILATFSTTPEAAQIVQRTRNQVEKDHLDVSESS